MSIDILVVDDDAPTLELMGEILLNFGIETQAIIDPQEAVGLIEKKVRWNISRFRNAKIGWISTDTAYPTV